MDFCRNVSLSGGLQPEQQQFGTLDDLFSGHSMEEGDVNMEWLSIFVEDCLSSSGNCLPPTTTLAAVIPANPLSTTPTATITSTLPKTSKPLHLVKTQLLENTPPSLHKFVVPGKARSKRKRSPLAPKAPFTRTTSWSHQFHIISPLLQEQGLNPDPPLLKQAYWLADSELILPKKEEGTSTSSSSSSRDSLRERGDCYEEEVKEEEKVKEEGELQVGQGQGQQGRRCTHCLSQRTPQWRAGPLGPKTLCNACGVRYKSGRLLPEYRPAKSPTFVSYKHSNSHKKVLEMRMSLLSSSNSSS